MNKGPVDTLLTLASTYFLSYGCTFPFWHLSQFLALESIFRFPYIAERF